MNMNTKYDISIEDAEYIYSKLEHFISIGINVYWQPINEINSINDLQEKLKYFAAYNKSDFINYLIKNNYNSSNIWDFGYSRENAELAKSMYYPWNYNLCNMLISYFTHNIEKSDLERYFELLDKNLPLVREILHKKYEECHGSPKWIDSAKIFGENIKKNLNLLFKKKKVIEYTFEEGDVHNKNAILTYTFSDNFDYQCKRKILQDFDNRFLAAYLSVDSALGKSLKPSLNYSQFIQIRFDDQGYKCASSDKVLIYLKSNKWQSLGMPDEAQFVPKLGHNKIS